MKVHLASPPDRPTVSARHGFRLGTSDRPTRRAQRGGANFELFWVGRPDRPTLFHRQRWVGSRFSGVSAKFTRPTDPPAPDSPLSGWVGPPARPTLSAAAPGRKVYFQLRTAYLTSHFSEICGGPFVICYLLSAICYLLSAITHHTSEKSAAGSLPRECTCSSYRGPQRGGRSGRQWRATRARGGR